MRGWIRRREREATCAEVAQVLQRYLDGHVDDLTARRVRRHLEHCRRCGLESETYLAIKAAVARPARPLGCRWSYRPGGGGRRLAPSADPTARRAAMIDLLLPATDRGVFVQMVVAGSVFAVAASHQVATQE